MKKYARLVAVFIFFACAAAFAPGSLTTPAFAEGLPGADGAPGARGKAAGFMPASEDLSPLNTKILSLSARNSTLRDILHTIAEVTGMNVVMEKGVNPDAPVTIALKNMTANDILEVVLPSVDYFYEIRGNVLTVKAYDTRLFELGYPAVTQDYSVEVGGDLLGGSGEGSASIGGNVSQKVKADSESFNLWNSVEKTLASMLSGGPANGPAVSGGPGFSVNRMTGSIIVTATKKDLKRVENYLDALRKILDRQVFVEASIVEVQLTDSLRYGIDWSFLGNGWNGVGVIGAGTSGFTNPLNSLPNFNISVTGGDFTALLKALREQGDVNVLSNPRISIMNGQTAFLSVGRKVDFISKVETTSTGTASSVPTVTFTVETNSVLSGMVFGLVPHISERNDGEISFSITPIISDLVKLDKNTIGVSGSNSVEISLPTVDLRELSTTVKVKSGDTVVIGGLIQNREKLLDKKVPLLGDIPALGALFTSREKVSEKTELVLILKPVVSGQETVKIADGGAKWRR